MINKIIIDGENVELTDKSQVPFRHTFQEANTHIVRYGIDNTDEICAYAFQDCKELSYITFPDEIKKIKRGAFKNCTSLKALPLSEHIEYIGKEAFDGCTSLTEIEFKGTTPPTMYCTLPPQTNIYVPDGSKFEHISYDDIASGKRTEYFTENAYSHKYEKIADTTWTDENGTYFYNRWEDIANDQHSFEVKNRVQIDDIQFTYTTLPTRFGLNDPDQINNTYTFLSYTLSPCNITNNQLYWYCDSADTTLETDINCPVVVDETADTVIGYIKVYTMARKNGKVTFTAYAESGVSRSIQLTVS